MNTPAASVSPVFTIANGIAIPPRTIPNAGPRDSKYPVDELQEGQAFFVNVTDEKQARQKQSQFAGLARPRGIALITRYIADEKTDPGFKAAYGDAVVYPILAVWHGGKVTEEEKAAKAARAAKAKATREAKAAQAAADSEGTPAVQAGGEAPAAQAPAATPAADDVIVLG